LYEKATNTILKNTFDLFNFLCPYSKEFLIGFLAYERLKTQALRKYNEIQCTKNATIAILLFIKWQLKRKRTENRIERKPIALFLVSLYNFSCKNAIKIQYFFFHNAAILCSSTNKMTDIWIAKKGLGTFCSGFLSFYLLHF
jgi:hypothetical protein